MTSKLKAVLAVSSLILSCRTPAAYRFQASSALDEADVKTNVSLEPAGPGRIWVRVSNGTDQLVQVDWRQVTLVDPHGTVTMPRPSVDLGWVKPGEVQVAELTPLSLPDSAPDADAYQGMHFTLRLPMVIHSEPTVRTHVLTTQVSQVGEAR